jgi:hypothetical protein
MIDFDFILYFLNLLTNISFMASPCARVAFHKSICPPQVCNICDKNILLLLLLLLYFQHSYVYVYVFFIDRYLAPTLQQRNHSHFRICDFVLFCLLT